MLERDKEGLRVKVISGKRFPEGTVGRILERGFVGNTKERIYCIQTEEIKNSVTREQTYWVFGKDLENVE